MKHQQQRSAFYTIVVALVAIVAILLLCSVSFAEEQPAAAAAVAVAAESEPAAPPAPPAQATIDESDVVVLDNSNFESLVPNSKLPWLVEFYAPWCGWCKKLTPIYAQVATALKGKVNVGKIDATENQALRKRFSIGGFPTIKFILDGKVYDYNKERTVEDFVAYVETSYKEIKEPKLIPPPISFLTQLQDDLYVKMLPMERWVEYHIWPFTIITFSTGILLGMAVSMCCCRRRPVTKPKKD